MAVAVLDDWTLVWGDEHDAPMVEERVVSTWRSNSPLESLVACDYCQQLGRMDDFVGGCKSCGAPKRMVQDMRRDIVQDVSGYNDADTQWSIHW